MPEVTRFLLIFHLGIGKRGGAVGAPVDNAAALIDEALLIQGYEHMPHGPGTALVHGEAGP
ncbi:hypothetical protein SDC9_97338 [bioreactor metagenome]|uniref:Uncharacterized protein n=1 Tax=bioreactor metagenome TaxID=1076179 RepID=A0A645ACC2_9ZZZZ